MSKVVAPYQGNLHSLGTFLVRFGGQSFRNRRGMPRLGHFAQKALFFASRRYL